MLFHVAGKQKEPAKIELENFDVNCPQSLKTIPNPPKSTKDNCYAKCKDSRDCLYAKYNKLSKDCALVSAKDKCKITRGGPEGSTVLGFAKRNYTVTNGVGYGSANPILFEGTSVPEDQCAAVCNLLPECKIALITGGRRSYWSCTVLGLIPPPRKLGERETSTAYIFK